MKEVSREEVIDETGRAYVASNAVVEVQLQDQGRTLKIYINMNEQEV